MSVQEQVNDKTVALSIKAAKLTANILAKSMQNFLKQKKTREPPVKSGKTSLKKLSKSGASLSNIEISDENIKSFERYARKYNVNFSLKKDDSGDTPRWLVFFKARDADSITAAFNEYSKALLSEKSKKKSVVKEVAKYAEIAKNAPVKNHKKGEQVL